MRRLKTIKTIADVQKRRARGLVTRLPSKTQHLVRELQPEDKLGMAKSIGLKVTCSLLLQPQHSRQEEEE
jgi:hypothetical protein